MNASAENTAFINSLSISCLILGYQVHGFFTRRKSVKNSCGCLIPLTQPRSSDMDRKLTFIHTSRSN